jgi:homocysteine S-methyltransferase
MLDASEASHLDKLAAVALNNGTRSDEETMSRFLDELSKAPILADGAMGSYLFARTGRLSEMNHVYEAFNADRPELIREVHLAYLRAGARCIKTNTFGANRSHLGAVGEGQRVEELNRTGVSEARQALEFFIEKSGDTKPRFMLGSVGPPMKEQELTISLREAYGTQLESLLDEGVDAILFETFIKLDTLAELVEFTRREFSKEIPLIAQMALGRSGYASSWNQDPIEFVEIVTHLGVNVVGLNCCAPWDATAFLQEVKDSGVRESGKFFLSAMPNAGGFQRIGNRYMTQVTPEYMGQLARTFAESGVQLVGGCCEVHPSHIREMQNYLHGYAAGQQAVSVTTDTATESAGDENKKKNGTFSRKIKEGEFAVSVEILPARGTAPSVLDKKVAFVEELAESGLADALDVTDGSRGISLIPPGDFIGVIRARLGWSVDKGDGSVDKGDGLELIPHFTGRDLNVMGVQSRLIGYHARRIHNVLFVTGDPPKMSPTYPRSTAVFDLDSTAMIRYAHSALNAGVDFGGQPLARDCDPRTHFTIGTGFEPEALDTMREVEKLHRKLDAGADYVMTQPVFHARPLERLEEFRSRVPILLGVMILANLEQARRVNEVPGVVIPESIFQRLSKFEDPADQGKLAVEIALEQVAQVKQQEWSGLYLMSPASHEPVMEVLQSGL